MRQMKDLMKDSRIQITQHCLDGFAGYYKAVNTDGSIIFSIGQGWEHASIRPFRGKMPTWADMCLVKDIIWGDDEWVVQYHPPKEEYVNNVDNCLHLWKPINEIMPTPPSMLVGVKGVEFT